MQRRHAWTTGSLTTAAAVVLVVTRRSSIGILGNLWPWTALLSWVVLVVATAGLVWWAWRRVVAVLCAGVLVDDAGGYWYAPGASPAGHDMYGMICEEPVDLGGGWGECGM